MEHVIDLNIVPNRLGVNL